MSKPVLMVMHHVARQDKGFTLTEVILTVFIVSLSLLAVINLIPMAYLTSRRGDHALTASHLAADALEAARHGSYDRLVVGRTVELEPQTVESVHYRIYRTVEAVSGYDADSCKRVAVNVSWLEKRGTGAQETSRVKHQVIIPRLPR